MSKTLWNRKMLRPMVPSSTTQCAWSLRLRTFSSIHSTRSCSEPTRNSQAPHHGRSAALSSRRCSKRTWSDGCWEKTTRASQRLSPMRRCWRPPFAVGKRSSASWKARFAPLTAHVSAIPAVTTVRARCRSATRSTRPISSRARSPSPSPLSGNPNAWRWRRSSWKWTSAALAGFRCTSSTEPGSLVGSLSRSPRRTSRNSVCSTRRP
mmetsp:Transcript_17520/g.48026  ORF Transcript_17520/g.48026 Transcript_17520/m.48026 type:complete len:208 (-) Transcript_17520:855-1478(-)